MSDSLLMSKTADAKSRDSASPTHAIQSVREESESDLLALRKTVQRASCSGCGPSGEGIAAELIGMPPAQRAPVMRALQQTRGNRYVGRLAVQAKLKIGQPGDKYEQEADRVAEAVMRMPEPQAVSKGTLFIQRTCPSCKEEKLMRQPIEEEEEELQRQPMEEEEEELQAKATSGHISEVQPNIESLIQSIRGGGKPLSENERTFFEPRFGYDFSLVRVHADSRASEASREVNARAFTVGQDVVFGEGQYRPETGQGKRLLAHELTHTIQQNGVSHRSKDWNMLIGRSQQRIKTSNYFLESGSDVLLRIPNFHQILHFRQLYTYIGENETFQTRNFSPDLSSGIRDWLARRMRVFVHEERPIDTLLRRLISAFRRAHRVLRDRIALRRSQRYTYTARIDISNASVQITDVRVNGLSPTAELVLHRFENFPPMQWWPTASPGEGCSTDFCDWVMGEMETRAPVLSSTTSLNCWEAILFAAYYAGVVSWQWLHNLYVRYHRNGHIAFANMLSHGQRIGYAPPRSVPARGDIVFFWSGNQLSHVGLATGRLNPRGLSPEIFQFQGRYSESAPPVRPSIGPPEVYLSQGRQMRIEYSRPPW